MQYSWHKESSVEVVCTIVDGKLVDDMDNGKILPECIFDYLKSTFPNMKDDEIFYFNIPFSSDGYYDEGSTYDNDTAYPPESSDERNLSGKISVCVNSDSTRKEFFLSNELSNVFFDFYERYVSQAELDFET